MMQGILVVDKPAGWTSFDVIAKLRGVLGTRKLGHSGTLDPMATGALPVFCGSASKAVDLQLDHDKTYRAVLRLGCRTDTGDVTGRVLEQRPVTGGEKELLEVLPRFVGPQMQTPPMYSAVKVNGQPLYKAARQGLEVERKPRPVTIHSLELVEQESPRDFVLRVRCSKGTYVRTLCHDIGQALECGGTMYSLRRTAACGYTERDAISLDALAQAAEEGTAERFLLPVDSLFSAYPALTVDARREKAARNGAAFPQQGAEGTYRVYGPGGDFLLLGQLHKGQLSTIKSFFEV